MSNKSSSYLAITGEKCLQNLMTIIIITFLFNQIVL